MNKKDLLLQQLKIDQENAERQVRNEIRILRGILDRIEQGLDENKVNADDGLQGNEWRLYKELSNLERLNEFIKKLEDLD